MHRAGGLCPAGGGCKKRLCFMSKKWSCSLLVGRSRDEDVDVHLSCDGAEGFRVAQGDNLVAVKKPNLERAVLDN